MKRISLFSCFFFLLVILPLHGEGEDVFLGRQAFSQPLMRLSEEGVARFEQGKAVFNRVWDKETGLGPLYNAPSCARCHIRDGRGHPPRDLFDDAVSMVLKTSLPSETNLLPIPHPLYGEQIQDFAVAPNQPEARVQVIWTLHKEFILPGNQKISLRKPDWSIDRSLEEDVIFSARIAPALIGMGLLEDIAEGDILSWDDTDDRDQDGISGKARNLSSSSEEFILGRFGWKASAASVAAQVARALQQDMGIVPSGEHAEIREKAFDDLVFYIQNLAVPQQRRKQDTDVIAGKNIFKTTGCVACHRPSFTTQAGRNIFPYSDLLLHDMGVALAKGAKQRQWRTAPLWGLGLTETVNGHTFLLHDGRARNILEAILWHDGEAKKARHAVEKLSAKKRHQLLSFLESL